MFRLSHAGRRARQILLFLFALSVATSVWPGSLELSPPAQHALDLLNNGHLLEAQDLLSRHRKESPDDISILLLFAMTRSRMMSLSTYSKDEKEELLAAMERLESLCEPKAKSDEDALFCYSAVQGIRAQLTGREGDWWATAKLGKKMKRTSEDLIQRDPDYNEAYYLLGSYNYFADALPGYIKFLRLFVFLPGGNRVEGMKQLTRAYEKGNLASIEAGRTLSYIYTYFERDAQDGLQTCEKILSRCPDGFDVGLYKGINLYYGSDFETAEEWLSHLDREVLGYSRMHQAKEGEAVPVYAALEREVRYWMARSLIRQKRLADAEKILLELKTPEVHQPYWIQRGVLLSLAEISYSRKKNDQGDLLIEQVLDWQNVQDAHDKARLLKKKKAAIGPFDIDFR